MEKSEALILRSSIALHKRTSDALPLRFLVGCLYDPQSFFQKEQVNFGLSDPQLLFQEEQVINHNQRPRKPPSYHLQAELNTELLGAESPTHSCHIGFAMLNFYILTVASQSATTKTF